MTSQHVTVLLEEAVSVLALHKQSVVFDCTLGEGGHMRRIMRELGPAGVYVGLDADPTAVAAAIEQVSGKENIHLLNRNFAEIKNISTELALTPTAILADLGWRTDQFTAGGKGFSFKSNEPLLMTFGDPADRPFTAHDMVNAWEEENLADVIYGYGEERRARRIAKAIVKAREAGEIKTAAELAGVVESAVPSSARHSRLHPATRTFQALRIAVNDELGALKKLLADGFEVLAPGGRMAIISFHSLEDRLVKQFFKEKIHDQEAVRLIKKPILPSEDERLANPRSRSAKLRVIEKNN